MVEKCPHCGKEVPNIPFKDKVVGYTRVVGKHYVPNPKRFKCSNCGGWYIYEI